jgi:hypothetical protein
MSKEIKPQSIHEKLSTYLDRGNKLTFTYVVSNSANVIISNILEFEYLFHDKKLILNLISAGEEISTIYFHLTNAVITDVYETNKLEQRFSFTLENDTMRITFSIYNFIN